MKINNLSLRPNQKYRRGVLKGLKLGRDSEFTIMLPYEEFAEMYGIDKEDVFAMDFVSTIMGFSHSRTIINSTYATSTILTGEDVSQIMLLSLYSVASEGCDWHEVRNKFFSKFRENLQPYKNNSKAWNSEKQISVDGLEVSELTVQEKDPHEALYLSDILTREEIAILFGEIESDYDTLTAIKMKAGYAVEPTDEQIKMVIEAFPTYGFRRINRMLKGVTTIAVTKGVENKIRRIIEG